MDISEMTVSMLKKECQARGLPVTGLKADLLTRLETALESTNEEKSAFTPKSELLNALLEDNDSVTQDISGISGDSRASIRIDVPPPQNFVVHTESGNTAIRWSKWVRSFEIYVSALGNVPDAQKRSLLLHVAGAEVQEIFSTFSEPLPTFQSALDALTKFLDPAKNIRYEHVSPSFLRRII